MAKLSAPIITIASTLDATKNNTNNITYSVINQTEEITSAEAQIYDADTNKQICTYSINNTPTSTAKGYLFPIQITSSNTNVTWNTGASISDWKNQKQYYIKIRVAGNSGWSDYGNAQPFYCLVSPTATLTNVVDPNSTNFIAQVNVNVGQTAIDNNISMYRMTLVDAYGDVVYVTDKKYGSGESVFYYQFGSLVNGASYQASFVGITENGDTVRATGSVFQINANSMLTGTLTSTDICEEGKIRVTFNGQTTIDSNVNVIAIERRGEISKSWVRLYEKNVNSTDISITYDDYFCASGVNYTYRIVPIIRQGDYDKICGSSTTTTTTTTNFQKVYITDGTESYGFISGVSNDSLTLNQQVSTTIPIGTKYPITIQNSDTNYQSGTIAGNILPTDYEDRRIFTDNEARQNMRMFRQKIQSFFTNGNAKILKDWNGNIWVIALTDTPTITFDANSDMSIASISCNWVEVGDINSSEDLARLRLSTTYQGVDINDDIDPPFIGVDNGVLVITNKPAVTVSNGTLDVVQTIGG